MFLPMSFFDKDYYTRFDGVNEYIDCGNDASLNFGRFDSFSISSWINVSALKTTDVMTKVLGSKGWVFGLNSPGLLRFMYYTNGATNGIFVKSNTSMLLNQWVHIAITYNGNSLANGVKLYENGVEVPTTTSFDNLLASASTTAPVRIGSSEFDTSSGDIDEISVYNSELTAANILDIYNKGRKKPNLNNIPNLLSHWRMNILNPIDEAGANDGTSIAMNNSNIIQDDE